MIALFPMIASDSACLATSTGGSVTFEEDREDSFKPVTLCPAKIDVGEDEFGNAPFIGGKLFAVFPVFPVFPVFIFIITWFVKANHNSKQFF